MATAEWHAESVLVCYLHQKITMIPTRGNIYLGGLKRFIRGVLNGCSVNFFLDTLIVYKIFLPTIDLRFLTAMIANIQHSKLLGILNVFSNKGAINQDQSPENITVARSLTGERFVEQ